MAHTGLVIDLGCDGGGADIYRTPNGSGGWQFHLGGTTIAVDDDDNEVWKQWSGPPVDTIAQALDQVAGNGGWLHFIPIEIHSEYRTIAWELALQAAKTHPRFKNWERTRGHRWRSTCFPDLNSGQGD